MCTKCFWSNFFLPIIIIMKKTDRHNILKNSTGRFYQQLNTHIYSTQHIELMINYVQIYFHISHSKISHLIWNISRFLGSFHIIFFCSFCLFFFLISLIYYFASCSRISNQNSILRLQYAVYCSNFFFSLFLLIFMFSWRL